MASDEQDSFESLLEFLRDSRGFDFTGYKRSSLERRVRKRMENVGIATFAEYLDYLQVHPDEFDPLFTFILINVTSFFRDSQIWDYLAGDIIPRIVEETDSQGPIRVWCAGVASGEEAYSVAMLLAEQIGREGFEDRVKIYATDVDDEALSQARQAIYSERSLQAIPPRLRHLYFERVPAGYSFDRDLRRSVIFGHHDLVQDAPISKVHLLICRNTVMYFNAETQARIMAHFNFALKDNGFLVLGKAEMLFTQVRSFAPIDIKRRVFRKATADDGMPELAGASSNPGNGQGGGQLGNHIRNREIGFDMGPVAQLLVDRHGFVVLANERARDLFGLQPGDVGQRLQDLELSYRPVELRSRIEEVTSTRQPVSIAQVPWVGRDGVSSVLDVRLVPLIEAGGRLLGVSVTFEDVSRYHELRSELETSNQELETAMEELQSTNEELETTNEELQSTNEELETTNEELQSTNEELETMNEELQSTNEELQAINDESRDRGVELNDVNAFLHSVMESIPWGVAVLDEAYHVEAWNTTAEDMWGLRAGEVRGESFFGLDFGLPVRELKTPMKRCLEGRSPSEEVKVEAMDRRGRSFTCKVTCTPLVGLNGPRGLVVLMAPNHQRPTS